MRPYFPHTLCYLPTRTLRPWFLGLHETAFFFFFFPKHCSLFLISVTQEALDSSDRHKLLFPSDGIARNYWISPWGPLYLFPGGSKDDSQSLKSFHVIKTQIYYHWINYIFDSKFRLSGKIRLLLSSRTDFIINLFIWNLIILGRSNKLFKIVFCPQTQI